MREILTLEAHPYGRMSLNYILQKNALKENEISYLII